MNSLIALVLRSLITNYHYPEHHQDVYFTLISLSRAPPRRLFYFELIRVGISLGYYVKKNLFI